MTGVRSGTEEDFPAEQMSVEYPSISKYSVDVAPNSSAASVGSKNFTDFVGFWSD